MKLFSNCCNHELNVWRGNTGIIVFFNILCEQSRCPGGWSGREYTIRRCHRFFFSASGRNLVRFPVFFRQEMGCGHSGSGVAEHIPPARTSHDSVLSQRTLEFEGVSPRADTPSLGDTMTATNTTLRSHSLPNGSVSGAETPIASPRTFWIPGVGDVDVGRVGDEAEEDVISNPLMLPSGEERASSKLCPTDPPEIESRANSHVEEVPDGL